MIAHLTGSVAAVGPTWVVLDLSGFGLKVLCTPGTASGVRLGQPAELHTSLVVREDSLTLYGFGSADERDCFELAQSASGIGPRIAQAMMSVLSPDEFRAAIAGEDQKALTRVPGIGPKGAQKMILEFEGQGARPRRDRAAAADRRARRPVARSGVAGPAGPGLVGEGRRSRLRPRGRSGRNRDERRGSDARSAADAGQEVGSPR